MPSMTEAPKIANSTDVPKPAIEKKPLLEQPNPAADVDMVAEAPVQTAVD